MSSSPLHLRDGTSEHWIYYESCVDGMKRLPDGSINLIVTSPPYWCFKDYDRPDQIGYNQSLADYRKSLRSAFAECFRVLQEGRRCIINIADMGISNKDNSDPTYRGNFERVPLGAYITQDVIDVGFKYIGEIMWCKIGNSAPQNGGNSKFLGSFPYPPNAHISSLFEHILIFRKREHPEQKNPRPSDTILAKSIISPRHWEVWTNQIWKLPGEKVDGHPAPFPKEIPRRCIRMWSFWGETVLDPFVGSGTTTAVAKELERNSIGFELNSDYREIQMHRIGLNASLSKYMKP